MRLVSLGSGLATLSSALPRAAEPASSLRDETAADGCEMCPEAQNLSEICPLRPTRRLRWPEMRSCISLSRSTASRAGAVTATGFGPAARTWPGYPRRGPGTDLRSGGALLVPGAARRTTADLGGAATQPRQKHQLRTGLPGTSRGTTSRGRMREPESLSPLTQACQRHVNLTGGAPGPRLGLHCTLLFAVFHGAVTSSARGIIVPFNRLASPFV